MPGTAEPTFRADLRSRVKDIPVAGAALGDTWGWYLACLQLSVWMAQAGPVGWQSPLPLETGLAAPSHWVGEGEWGWGSCGCSNEVKGWVTVWRQETWAEPSDSHTSLPCDL